MATRNIVHTVTYLAWDTGNNVGKTGDNPSVNHTLKWVKDGALEAVDGTPAEVDATNAPGIYKVALTADGNETAILGYFAASLVQPVLP